MNLSGVHFQLCVEGVWIVVLKYKTYSGFCTVHENLRSKCKRLSHPERKPSHLSKVQISPWNSSLLSSKLSSLPEVGGGRRGAPWAGGGQSAPRVLDRLVSKFWSSYLPAAGAPPQSLYLCIYFHLYLTDLLYLYVNKDTDIIEEFILVFSCIMYIGIPVANSLCFKRRSMLMHSLLNGIQ